MKAGRQLPSGLDRAAPLLSRSKHMLALNAGKCMWERWKGWNDMLKCEVKYKIKHLDYLVVFFFFLQSCLIFFCREKYHNVEESHTHPHSFMSRPQAFSLLKHNPDIQAWNRRLLKHDISQCFSQTHTHAHSVHVCWAKWPAFISLVGKSPAAVRRQWGCRCES